MSQRNSSPILLLLPLLLPRYQKLSPIKRKHSLNQHLGMLSLCLYLNQTPKSSAACQHFLNLQHQLLPPDFPVRFFLSLLFLFMTDTNQESGSLFLQFWWVLIYYCIVWFISWPGLFCFSRNGELLQLDSVAGAWAAGSDIQVYAGRCFCSSRTSSANQEKPSAFSSILLPPPSSTVPCL